jgi:hypothetical protein
MLLDQPGRSCADEAAVQQPWLLLLTMLLLLLLLCSLERPFQ